MTDEVAATAEKLEELAVNGEDPLLEKKKKKKKKGILTEVLDAVEGGEAGDEEELAAFDLTTKKKKKKKAKARADDEFGADEAGEELGEDGAKEAGASASGLPWDGTDRDYTYEEMLDRAFGILREHNPNLGGGKKRTTLKPPQVAREGTKKTVFTNFMELSKAMNRQHEHVQAYLMAEMGTSGSLDGQQRLVIKGRFAPKDFENILRRYVNEYVLCSSCKSPDTLLDRDSASRIMFLRCQQCGASRTVAPIKAGFVARTSRRKAS